MRGWLILPLLALAGCGEHRGLNPNYLFEDNPYGDYRTAREAALVTGDEPSRVIPVARPFYSPTPVKIAGQDPVPIPATKGLTVVNNAIVKDPDAPIPIVSPKMMP
jgi:hypothetical protein